MHKQEWSAVLIKISKWRCTFVMKTHITIVIMLTYFWGILSGERSSPMCSPTTICIHNYLATCETSISLRSSNDKSAWWLNVINGFIVKVFGWDHNLETKKTIRNNMKSDITSDQSFEIQCFPRQVSNQKAKEHTEV